jgi:hypothetical protein
MTKLKEQKCERCGDLFEQGYCNDDALEVDVCQICAEHIEAEQNEIANRKE